MRWRAASATMYSRWLLKNGSAATSIAPACSCGRLANTASSSLWVLPYRKWACIPTTEYRWGAGDPTRMRAHAKELMGTSPDVLVTESTPATAALQSETRTTPIVFLQAGNPVDSGFVTSFARPGGNLTGFTNYAPTMGGKWLELLKEMVPRLVRAAALFNPKTHTGQYWAVLEAAAQTVNVQFAKAAVADAAEIERAVEVMSGEPSGGLLVMPDSFTMSHQETIVASAARHRVPAIYAFRAFPASGGLMSTGCSRRGGLPAITCRSTPAGPPAMPHACASTQRTCSRSRPTSFWPADAAPPSCHWCSRRA